MAMGLQFPAAPTLTVRPEILSARVRNRLETKVRSPFHGSLGKKTYS